MLGLLRNSTNLKNKSATQYIDKNILLEGKHTISFNSTLRIEGVGGVGLQIAHRSRLYSTMFDTPLADSKIMSRECNICFIFLAWAIL